MPSNIQGSLFSWQHLAFDIIQRVYFPDIKGQKDEVFSHCTLIADENQHFVSQVSWVRHRDTHLLTLGMYKYTPEDRFSAIHKSSSEDWVLEIRGTTLADEGVYECQVSTTPVRRQLIRLKVAGETSFFATFMDQGGDKEKDTFVRGKYKEKPEKDGNGEFPPFFSRPGRKMLISLLPFSPSSSSLVVIPAYRDVR